MPPPSSKRSPTGRILQEITNNTRHLDPSAWERIGPAGDGEDLFHWEAVLLGSGLVDPNTPTNTSDHINNWQRGYASGKWLLEIRIPDTYPVKPPMVKFDTRMVHPNVDFQTGEICLSLLKEGWTPAYTVLTTLEAVRQMIREGGEVDSPLNVDLAALVRGGDGVGAEGLVRFFTGRDARG